MTSDVSPYRSASWRERTAAWRHMYGSQCRRCGARPRRRPALLDRVARLLRCRRVAWGWVGWGAVAWWYTFHDTWPAVVAVAAFTFATVARWGTSRGTNIHHRYDRQAQHTLGIRFAAEPDYALVALCDRCHARVHARANRTGRNPQDHDDWPFDRWAHHLAAVTRSEIRRGRVVWWWRTVGLSRLPDQP